MTDKQYEQDLDLVLAEIKALLLKKHHDYGESNLMEFGELGILIRSSDKLSRLKNIIATGEIDVDDETTKATWADLAGYAIQCLTLFYESDEQDEINQLFEDAEAFDELYRLASFAPKTTFGLRFPFPFNDAPPFRVTL